MYAATITITAEANGVDHYKATCEVNPKVIMDPDSLALFQAQIDLATRVLLGSMIKNGVEPEVPAV